MPITINIICSLYQSVYESNKNLITATNCQQFNSLHHQMTKRHQLKSQKLPGAAYYAVFCHMQRVMHHSALTDVFHHTQFLDVYQALVRNLPGRFQSSVHQCLPAAIHEYEAVILQKTLNCKNRKAKEITKKLFYSISTELKLMNGISIKFTCKLLHLSQLLFNQLILQFSKWMRPGSHKGQELLGELLQYGF